jgi:hypothetical protein
MKHVQFEGMHYRRDIGHQALRSDARPREPFDVPGCHVTRTTDAHLSHQV